MIGECEPALRARAGETDGETDELSGDDDADASASPPCEDDGADEFSDDDADDGFAPLVVVVVEARAVDGADACCAVLRATRAPFVNPSLPARAQRHLLGEGEDDDLEPALAGARAKLPLPETFPLL